MLDLEQFTGFTPGPWRVSDKNTIFGPANGNPSPVMIAHMARTDSYRSNSILIAAAPELLAECKRLRAELVKYDRAANILACLDPSRFTDYLNE